MAKKQELKDSLTQSGLNLIQQALSIYDGDLKLAVCNSRFQEMFDLPDHLTTTGANFAETIRYLTEKGEYGDVGNIASFVQEKVDQALDFEAHYVERQRSNGRMISVEGSPLGQGGWVTVYTDITAIKRHEALLRSHSAELSDQLLSYSEEIAQTNRELAATISALEEAKRNLTDSEARTRMTAEMMPAHIAHLDLEERYTYSNRKLPTIIPDRKMEIVGQSAEEALGQEAFTIIRPWLDKAYQGEASVFEFTHSQGSRRIRCAFTPDFGPDDQVNGVYILSMNITEEAQARAALAQTHKRELAAQLTSGLAHDFGNLLTIILGLQGRLEKLENLPEAALKLTAPMRSAALRGGTLLNRLSDVSGHRKIQIGATDISQLLSETGIMANPSLPRSIKLTTEVEGIDRPVLLDNGFLQDSLLNLILNARDSLASSDGQIKVKVTSEEAVWLQITISDTGPGFSDEALEHAVDPFFSTKHKHDGSGLGLSMVYDFAQLSGGHLKIANKSQGGAIVTLRLPLKFASRKHTPRFVLLIEDTHEIRTNIREMLRALGHSVVEAANADEVEALTAIPEIDTVLTDIKLGGDRSGLDIARDLNAILDKKQLFVMTSLSPNDDLRKAAAAEFAVIGKPFSEAELSYFLETGSV